MNRIRVIVGFGFKLIRLCPATIAAYALLSFISQTAIPLTLPVLLAKVTDSSQIARPLVSPAAPDKQSHVVQRTPGSDAHDSILPPYLEWLALTFALLPLGILFRLAQTRADGRMEREIRQRVFDKVLHQSPTFFQRYTAGKLSSVLNQTTVEAEQAFRNLTVDPVLEFASLSTATVLIVWQLKRVNGEFVWPMVLAMVLFGIVSVSIVQWKGDKPVFHAQMEVQQQRFLLSNLVDAAVKSAEEIQAMDGEPLFSRRHDEGLANLVRLKLRQVRTMELVNSAIGLPTQVILGALYGLIVYRTMSGNTSVQPGVFIALAGLAPQLMQPFRTFSALGIIASSSWPAVQLTTQLLQEDNPICDMPDARDVKQLAPTLEVRNITFGYGPHLPKVFVNLSFAVPSQKITSLVARMGQGKTTFFRLALRFYEPESGEVVLGGLPVRSFTLESLRRHAVMMSQFPAFFHDTVRENFRIANPAASDGEIRTWCEQTGLWSVLEQAIGPDPLGRPFAAGMGLSGGQKRLFALTRCLLRDPTFLFLDEPTTNMSNDEKRLLIPVMRAACTGRTVIVVDHDISWLTLFSDHFIVLNDGRVVQEGTATRLLAQPGLLRELYSVDPQIMPDPDSASWAASKSL